MCIVLICNPLIDTSVNFYRSIKNIRGGQGKAIRIEGICKSSQKLCFLSHLVSDGQEVLDYYRIRFQFLTNYCVDATKALIYG